MRSPIYSHPRVYEWTMRLLYGRRFHARYASILPHIPPTCGSLAEVCMGDAYFYRHHLKPLVRKYRGYDINERFVRSARRIGIDAHLLDLRTDTPTEADVILMQASLYQFMPNHHDVISRLLNAARDRVIIAEPVENVTGSTNPLKASIGAKMSDAGYGSIYHRFTEESFTNAMMRYDDKLLYLEHTIDSREMIAVIAV